MSHHYLSLTPRDGLFLKDGRGWYTSSSGRASSYDWPAPTTVRGALCSASGIAIQEFEDKDFEEIDWETTKEQTRLKAMLAVRKPVEKASWAPRHRMWPVPQDAFYAPGKANVVRLTPRPPSDEVQSLSWNDRPHLEALWRPEAPTDAKPMDRPRWWTDGDFQKWLAGAPVERHTEVQQEQLELNHRTQIHVKINRETGTAEDQHLWATETLEMLQKEGKEWAIAVDCHLPPDLPSEESLEVTLGGKRRLARTAALPPRLFECPDRILDAFQGNVRGLRLIAVTPLHFTRGWLPDRFEPSGANNQTLQGELPGIDEKVILRSACVPRPRHISGWDMARGGAKPTRRLVRPGSVYFFEKASNNPFEPGEIEQIWLAQIGRDQSDGFGCVVPGVWHLEE